MKKKIKEQIKELPEFKEFQKAWKGKILPKRGTMAGLSFRYDWTIVANAVFEKFGVDLIDTIISDLIGGIDECKNLERRSFPKRHRKICV